MKKWIFLSVLLALLNSTLAFSAGIYENANQSAEFIRTVTRYASTDIDAVFYNPAGTAFMKEGLYTYLSDQMLFDYQTITDSSSTLSDYSYQSKYDAEAMTWAFPDIYAVYRENNWSLFLHMGLIGRGAAATYKDCLPMINKGIITYAKVMAALSGGTLTSIKTDGELEAYAYFIGFTLGGAYKVNDMFSVGGGVRYVHAEQNIKLKYNFINVTSSTGDITSSGNFDDIDVDVDASGDSAGFIGSFDVIPVKNINIGFRYEYYTPMKVTNDKPKKFDGPALVISNPQFSLSKGDYTKMTLPMNASVGISYMVTPELKAEVGFIYYFNKEADWGKDSSGADIASKYDNGYDASISLEYAFMPQLKGSIGCSYSVSGVNSKTRNNEQLGLDANSIGVGGTYTFANGIDFTLATMVVMFKDTTESNAAPDSGSTKYEDRVYSVAASVSYKFM